MSNTPNFDNAPTTTNTLMRTLAKIGFGVGLILTLLDGTEFYEANETLVTGIMLQAATFLGITTTRNIFEHRDVAKIEAAKTTSTRD